MSRLLVIGALPLSLVVPAGAIALAVSASSAKPDQQVIQMPASLAPAPGHPSTSAPATTLFKLFGGKTIEVDQSCADSHHLGAKKRGAIAAANKMPRLKLALLNSKRDFSQFLSEHPGHTLAPVAFSTYKSLRKTYESARRAFNRRVDSFNRLADRYNADLHECKA
jgi:hypothetical protein